MLLSRFWYVILAIAAAAGVAAAILASNLVNEERSAIVEGELRRDRIEVEQILKLEARARIDAIAPFAANADVRSALRQASARRAGEAVPAEIATRLRAKLVELNQQLAGVRGDLVFAVDQEGWIVAAIAPGRIPEGAGLGQFPLVARALEGLVRDDVWVYNDAIYRMAARPVVEGGQYVGALVHGKRLDDQFAELLSTRLGTATVAFFRGGQMEASYMPAGAQTPPPRDQMGQLLDDVLQDERFRAGERTEPRQLEGGGLAVYSLVTGTARRSEVGYAIGRPVPPTLGPLDLLSGASKDDWMDVLEHWNLWAPVLAIALLVAILAVWIERDRPLGRMRRAASGLAADPENRLTTTDFGGQYRKIAHHVNDALDQVAQAGGAAGPKRKAANLDEILGPNPQEAGPSPSFFGFAGQAGPQGLDLPTVPPATGQPAGALPPLSPPARPPGPPPVGAAPPRPSPPKPPPPGPPGTPPSAKKPPPRLSEPEPETAKIPVKAAQTAVQAAAAAPAEASPPLAASQRGEAPHEKPAAAHGVAAAPTAPAPSAPAPGAPSPATTAQRKMLKRTLVGVAPPADDDDDDGATMVARVPEELLAQSASIQTGGAAEEDKHFREVFEKFVATKQECGEPTAGLTYEKFVVTLRKNRDQIVSRHGARKVRFNVYVKAGKAALKATPIRE